jgi:polyisoprenoid-binding protein YceI
MAQQKTWIVDQAHSELQFKVRHMVISTVTGSFENFTARVESENDDFDQARVTLEADVASINTNNTDRDNHLKSNDFFGADTHPKLTFTGILRSGASYRLVGDLTIKGVTKSLELAVDFNGAAKDPWGNLKAGFEITGKLNRNDFGLTWNAVIETGGVLVSEEVKLLANIQLQQA